MKKQCFRIKDYVGCVVQNLKEKEDNSNMLSCLISFILPSQPLLAVGIYILIILQSEENQREGICDSAKMLKITTIRGTIVISALCGNTA